MQSEYINPAEYEKLYSAMQYQNVLAMRIAVETGLRIDDVLSLTWGDLEGRKLRFTAKKTGKGGAKTLSADLSKRLEVFRGGKNEFLFPGRDHSKHRTRQSVWKDVKRAAVRLGIAGHISPHSARKTYAVGVRQTQGLAAAQRELQHSRMDTTMLYAFSDIMAARPQAAQPAADELDRLADMIAERIIKKLSTP